MLCPREGSGTVLEVDPEYAHQTYQKTLAHSSNGVHFWQPPYTIYTYTHTSTPRRHTYTHQRIMLLMIEILLCPIYIHIYMNVCICTCTILPEWIPIYLAHEVYVKSCRISTINRNSPGSSETKQIPQPSLALGRGGLDRPHAAGAANGHEVRIVLSLATGLLLSIRPPFLGVLIEKPYCLGPGFHLIMALLRKDGHAGPRAPAAQKEETKNTVWYKPTGLSMISLQQPPRPHPGTYI